MDVAPTIVVFQDFIIAIVVFILVIVIVLDGHSGAGSVSRLARLTRHDYLVFVVVGCLCIIDGLLDLWNSMLANDVSAMGWARHTLRVGLLLGRTFAATAVLSSSSVGDEGGGKESLEILVSRTIASRFSWELRGSTASLLGTGVMLTGRFAMDSELLFVVSFRHDDFLFPLEADVVLLDVGVALFDLGCVEALEKKPKMLCCFPVDEGVLAGVDFSPMLAGDQSINQIDTGRKDKCSKKTSAGRQTQHRQYAIVDGEEIWGWLFKVEKSTGSHVNQVDETRRDVT